MPIYVIIDWVENAIGPERRIEGYNQLDVENDIYAHGSGKNRMGAVSDVYWMPLFLDKIYLVRLMI